MFEGSIMIDLSSLVAMKGCLLSLLGHSFTVNIRKWNKVKCSVKDQFLYSFNEKNLFDNELFMVLNTVNGKFT